MKWFYLNLKYHDNTQLYIKPTSFLVKLAHCHYILSVYTTPSAKCCSSSPIWSLASTEQMKHVQSNCCTIWTWLYASKSKVKSILKKKEQAGSLDLKWWKVKWVTLFTLVHPGYLKEFKDMGTSEGCSYIGQQYSASLQSKKAFHCVTHSLCI